MIALHPVGGRVSSAPKNSIRHASNAGFIRILGGSVWSCMTGIFLGFDPIAPALEAAGSNHLDQLRRELSVVLNNPLTPGATWGVSILGLANGTNVFSSNSDHLFTPASCTKLFTAALALDSLGAEFQITTPLQTSGEVTANGSLAGDLVWVGRGATDLSERRSGSLTATLAPFVNGVIRAGIKQITGSIVADESYFKTHQFGPGWNWDDLSEGYGAAVTALTLNDNVARVLASPGQVGSPVTLQIDPFPSAFTVVNRSRTVGPDTKFSLRFERLPNHRDLWVFGEMPVDSAMHEERLALPEPALAAAEALQEALEKRGIRVDQPCRVVGEWKGAEGFPGVPRAQAIDGAVQRWRILAAVTSAPLGELVRDCLKTSQNLHAQLLWLQVGAEFQAHSGLHPSPPMGAVTDAGAQQALVQFLRKLSLNGNDFAFEEGSGLSRKDLVTPAATVRLLRYMNTHPRAAVREAWMAALPIGGIDGTLKSRFTQVPTRGNVRAKSGTLRYVHALAGYVTTAGGDPLAFALYANGFATADPQVSGREQVDRLVEILAAYSGHL